MAATESTSKMKTVTGTHRFTFHGYSLSKGVGAGRCFRSGTFTVGGFDWASAATTPTATTAPRPGPSSSSASSTRTPAAPQRVFASNRPDAACFGRRAFMERAKLEASPSCLRDDCVVIDCAVTVVLDKPVVAATDDGNLPPSNILRQIVSQIEADGADVTFTVGEEGNNPEKFTAHRLMLAARLPVFRAELYGAMRENDSSHVITITDIQPSVFKAFLHFIYTDDMPPELLAVAGEEDENNNTTKVDMARHLLVAARTDTAWRGYG
uniref:BTB domain-containing protein n=1 Tax=Leersia perrieri TaxID=77586 RepID=A0A0D9X413_9ORYZ